MPSEPTSRTYDGPLDIHIEHDRRADRVLLEVVHAGGVCVSLILTTQRARELAADLRDVCS